MFRGAARKYGTLAALLFGMLLAATSSFADEKDKEFRVTGVDEWDVLYVRETPDAAAKIVGALPSNAKGIRILRQRQEAADWRRIVYRDIKGWVNVAFIEEDIGDGRPHSLATRLSCDGTNPVWNLTIADGKALFLPAGETRQLLYTRIPKMAVNRATTWAIEAHDAKTDRSAVFVIRASGECVEGQATDKQPYEVFGNFTAGVVVNGCCSPF